MAESNADIARRLRELLLTCGLDGYVLLRADYAEKIASRLEALQEGASEEMVEAGARQMAKLVERGLIVSPGLTAWEPWSGSARSILEAALSARPLGGGK